jgi:hypothetical protein
VADVLSDLALNRATLARQSLLARSEEDPVAAVERLVGLQSQNPLDPYLALWSRLTAFDPARIGDALERRELVRIVVMRGTIHLVTAADGLAMRPLVQPVLDAEIARHSEFAPLLVGIDVATVVEAMEPVLAERPMSGAQLRAAIEARFPRLPAAALAYACRCHLALVQIPPRGVWGRSLQVTSTPLTAWVGRPLDVAATLDDLVVRYLEAFGPATVADAQAWCRLPGLEPVFDRLANRLGDRLRTFRDERGRLLYDLDDAPRPDPATPAPVRFLPEYDNVLLSHGDRRRFGLERAAFGGPDRPRVHGSVLVDGEVRAVWHRHLDPATGVAEIGVDHLPLTKRLAASVEAEARRVSRFWHPAASAHAVRLLPVDGSAAGGRR